jgi:hypothetical protein
MRPRPIRLATVAALGAAALLTGCRQSNDLSLCPAWETFANSAADITKDSTAAEWLVAVDEVLGDLDQLSEVADSRQVVAIDNVETALESLQGTLESVDADQPYTIWAPLVSDDFDAVADADQQLRDLIEPECPTTPTTPTTEDS